MKRFTLSNLKYVFELLLGRMKDISTAFQSSIDEIYENIDSIQEGEIKSDDSTVGGSSHPIYLSDHTLKACTATVGNDSHPVYMSTGTITTCTADIGSDVKPIYMSGGAFIESTANVGDSETPIYMSDGELTVCDSGFGGDVVEEDIDEIFNESSDSDGDGSVNYPDESLEEPDD